MKFGSNTSLINANFFFIDIVGLSNPKLSTKSQVKKINILNDLISKCDVFQSTPKENRIQSSTGDGLWIGFLQGPELPFLLSIQLHQKLSEYNKAKIPSETVHIRIGLHNGICYLVNDIDGNKDVWGPGIILARRVMDIGDDDHILLSPRLAEDLKEISDEFSKTIYPVHDFTIKHGVRMLIYSAYGDGFGNSQNPSKDGVQESKMGKMLETIQRTTIYPYVKVGLTIKDPKTMLVHHQRKYVMENISDKPIISLLHGIGTDVEKTIQELNINVFEDDGSQMKLSSINMDKPFNKEFTTLFSNPILKGEVGRNYTLEYDVEEPERYYENAFLVDCKKFELSFSYPENSKLQPPILYDIVQETDKIKKSNLSPITESKDGFSIVRWTLEDVSKGTTLRIEW